MSDFHPYEPFIPDDATKLIIGSIPPHRFCKDVNNQIFGEVQNDDVRFYYGSNVNSFWPIIGNIYNIQFDFQNTELAIQQRISFLQDINIGITDIIASCDRNNNGAQDSDLFNITYKNIRDLLINNPQINTLIYTSDFIKICVNNIFNTYHRSTQYGNRRKTVTINNTDYDVWILYSPSRNALRNMGENGNNRRKNQYKKVFG